jgi:hypothetical protein
VRVKGAARIVVVLGAAAAFCVPAARGDEAPPAPPPGHVVKYVDDTLTVRLAKVPVSEVLSEIGRQSGAEIRGQVRDARDVSAEFDAVPLPDALHRLLGDQNFALIYADGGRLRAVKLLGGPQAAPPSAPGPPPTMPPVMPTPMTAAGLMGLFERHAPIPISGRLAEAMQTDQATFAQLVDVGLHNEDPVLRLEAVRTTVQAVENDPALRAGLLGTVNGMDMNEMATMFRGAAGERAEELAMHLATQTKVTELRAKASSLLQQLRRGRPGAPGA